MAKGHLGKLPPRYKFILNRYEDARLSKCPLCKKPTHERKFALFVHIDEWGPLLIGKDCKYCSPCEMIIAHQHELEEQMAYTFSTLAPEIIGNEYMVMGTVEKKIWERGLEGDPGPMGEILKHMADFKKVYDLTIEPGGWYPADKVKSKR